MSPPLSSIGPGKELQFVMHFNEQFRQLDEVSPPDEILPYPTRLTL